jgi:hypothetical protein
MTLQELEKQVQELQARSTANIAFLRCAIFTLSTPQLRGTKETLEKLAEDMSVKLLYMGGASDDANHAFEAQKKFWFDALASEISARETTPDAPKVS